MDTNATSHDPEYLVHQSLTCVEAALVQQFKGVVEAETVHEVLAQEVQALRWARVQDFIPILAERAARLRLVALTRVGDERGAARR